ncbi:MAG: ribokinase [Rhodospirillaceae bacterium]|nr:ribokinase [Rhodospirillaceae bacterium]
MIHVVGNVAIDTVVRMARFPAPGETIVADGAAEDMGGKGANQAVLIARAGLPVRLVAAVGRDEAGERVRARLAREGVLIDGLWTWSGPTDRCIVYVDAAGENTIVSLIGAAQAFDPLAATDLAGRVEAGDTLLFQGNLRPAVLRRCLAFARERGAWTVLNPSPVSDPADYAWGLVDLAVVNRGEARARTGEAEPARAAAWLVAAGAGAVAVTLGAAGALLLHHEGSLSRPAPRVPVADTTGAGDVFAGVLVAARRRGMDWDAALAAAVEAAALSVTRAGVLASFPTAAELAALIGRTAPRAAAGAAG